MKEWLKARGRELWRLFWHGETNKKELERLVYNAPFWIGDVIGFKHQTHQREGLVMKLILCPSEDDVEGVACAEVISHGVPFIIPFEEMFLVEKGERTPNKEARKLLEELEAALPNWRKDVEVRH